jgi:hypothetical protein
MADISIISTKVSAVTAKNKVRLPSNDHFFTPINAHNQDRFVYKSKNPLTYSKQRHYHPVV